MKALLVAMSLGIGLGGGWMLEQMSMGALHTFGNSEVPTAVNLNNNFSFLNTNKIGGGVQLSNTDVAAGAAISHSKLATPALVPKAWAVVTSNCTGSAAAGTACTAGDSSQLTVSTNAASGVFRGTLAYTPANTSFAILVTSHTTASVCVADTRAVAAPHFLVKCFDYTGAAYDVNQFSILVMDT